jgi:hypothetical protein
MSASSENDGTPPLPIFPSIDCKPTSSSEHLGHHVGLIHWAPHQIVAAGFENPPDLGQMDIAIIEVLTAQLNIASGKSS